MLPELTTNRLRLSPATLGDLDALHALWDEPDVRRFLFDNAPITRERASEVLEHCRRAGAGLGLWLVRLHECGSAIGCVGLMPSSVVDGIEPLAAFTPLVWGNGYATEALAAVIDYAFERLRLPELIAVNDVPNAASDRLARRLGFEPAGECDGPAGRLRLYRKVTVSRAP